MIGLVNREDLNGWISLYRDTLTNSDIETTNVGFSSPNTPLLSETLAKSYNLRRECKKSDIEILHFLSNAYIETSINLSKLSDKTVVTVQDIFHLQEDSILNNIKEKLVRRNLKNADKIITISNYTRKEIVDKLGVEEHKIEVIPIPISPIFEPKDSKSLDLPKNYILYVGSGIERKNLDFLFEVHSELVKRYEDLHLVLAGPISDEKESELSKLAQKLDTDQLVKFTDWIDEKNMPELYSRAEIYVQPSKKEGQGIPPIEAMACGTPPIVSNSTALPETVGNQNLVADLGLEDFEDKITRLLDDKSLYDKLRDYGLERSKYFSQKKCVEKHKELYESL